MTSLQRAENKIKDLTIQNKNLKMELKIQKEAYEEKISKMENNFNNKFDSIMSMMSNLENKVDKLEKENEELKKENEILKKENAELRKENDILKGKAIQKNSSNSNIPPSKDEYKVQNHREKSSNKQGGQKGRKGKTLTIQEINKLIETGKAEVIEEHYGDKTS